MKSCVALAFLVFGTASAVEPIKLPMELGTLKTTDGKVYDGVKVMDHDAVGVKIMHEAGTARIAFNRLPRDIAKRFEVDPAAAREQLEKEAREMEANEREVQAMTGGDPKKAATTETAKDEEEFAEVAAMPSLDGKATDEKVAALKNYIVHLKKGIVELEADLVRRQERANRAERRAEFEYLQDNSVKSAKSASSVRRAEAIRRMADKGYEKIDQANALIRKAEMDIATLLSAKP